MGPQQIKVKPCDKIHPFLNRSFIIDRCYNRFTGFITTNGGSGGGGGDEDSAAAAAAATTTAAL